MLIYQTCSWHGDDDDDDDDEDDDVKIELNLICSDQISFTPGSEKQRVHNAKGSPFSWTTCFHVMNCAS